MPGNRVANRIDECLQGHNLPVQPDWGVSCTVTASDPVVHNGGKSLISGQLGGEGCDRVGCSERSGSSNKDQYRAAPIMVIGDGVFVGGGQVMFHG